MTLDQIADITEQIPCLPRDGWNTLPIPDVFKDYWCHAYTSEVLLTRYDESGRPHGIGILAEYSTRVNDSEVYALVYHEHGTPMLLMEVIGSYDYKGHAIVDLVDNILVTRMNEEYGILYSVYTNYFMVDTVPHGTGAYYFTSILDEDDGTSGITYRDVAFTSLENPDAPTLSQVLGTNPQSSTDITTPLMRIIASFFINHGNTLMPVVKDTLHADSDTPQES